MVEISVGGHDFLKSAAWNSLILNRFLFTYLQCIYCQNVLHYFHAEGATKAICANGISFWQSYQPLISFRMISSKTITSNMWIGNFIIVKSLHAFFIRKKKTKINISSNHTAHGQTSSLKKLSEKYLRESMSHKLLKGFTSCKCTNSTCISCLLTDQSTYATGQWHI